MQCCCQEYGLCPYGYIRQWCCLMNVVVGFFLMLELQLYIFHPPMSLKCKCCGESNGSRDKSKQDNYVASSYIRPCHAWLECQ